MILCRGGAGVAYDFEGVGVVLVFVLEDVGMVIDLIFLICLAVCFVVLGVAHSFVLGGLQVACNFILSMGMSHDFCRQRWIAVQFCFLRLALEGVCLFVCLFFSVVAKLWLWRATMEKHFRNDGLPFRQYINYIIFG